MEHRGTPTAAWVRRDRRRLRLLLAGFFGNLMLLAAMCSATFGSLEEAWILDQADDCITTWRSEHVDDRRAAFTPVVIDERWHSRTEAEFLITMPVTEPDGSSAVPREYWLACTAHQEKEGDDSVTVIDTTELRP